MRDKIKVLITENKVRARIKELAEEIANDYSNKEEVLALCVLKGGIFFCSELMKAISAKKEIPMKVDFIKAKSYIGRESSGDVIIDFDLDLKDEIENKHVLVVEDILDTGMTLKKIKEFLEEKNPKSVKIVTLLNKPLRRKVKIEPDYNGFKIEDKFVVGYGLDYNEKYRGLPYIGYIEEE